MYSENCESYDSICRIFGESVKLLGLNQQAGNVLAAIYIHETLHNEPISTDDIKMKINLSNGYISSICYRLEIHGIISKVVTVVPKKRGRRTNSYSLRVGLDSILRLGIEKYQTIIAQSLEDFRISGKDTNEWGLLVNRLENETTDFLQNDVS